MEICLLSHSLLPPQGKAPEYALCGYITYIWITHHFLEAHCARFTLKSQCSNSTYYWNRSNEDLELMPPALPKRWSLQIWFWLTAFQFPFQLSSPEWEGVKASHKKRKSGNKLDKKGRAARIIKANWQQLFSSAAHRLKQVSGVEIQTNKQNKQKKSTTTK